MKLPSPILALNLCCILKYLHRWPKIGPARPTRLGGINCSPSMTGERVHFHVGPVLLKRQPSGVYQMLDPLFKGQTFFGGVARGFPMVCASCVRVTPLWERRLVDLLGRYHSHLVGNEGRQEVFIRHWDRGEFWNWPRGKVPHHVGIDALVGIAGRASRGWSRSLGGLPLDGGGRSRLYGC